MFRLYCYIESTSNEGNLNLVCSNESLLYPCFIVPREFLGVSLEPDIFVPYIRKCAMFQATANGVEDGNMGAQPHYI